MICLSVFVENYREACAAVEKHGVAVSVVELRCDSGDETLLAEAADAIKRPLIITCRSREHGGLWNGSEAERARFLERSLRFRPLYLDVELGSTAEELIARYPDQQTILSFHGTPEVSSWDRLLDRAYRRNTSVVKFIPDVRNWDDNLHALELVRRYDARGKNLICHCSGHRGMYSRILAPAYGSMLAYCCASSACNTSEGQFTVEEALELYRLPKIRRSWRIYGIAGSPVAHSRSPKIMNGAFAACSIDAVYLPFEVDNFQEFIGFAYEAALAGLSVTAPHKAAAFETSARGDDVASAAHSANTLLWTEEGYHAANTDGHGFLSAFTKNFGPVSNKKIVILGAGGAARGVAYVLKDNGASVFLCGRNADAVRNVAESLGIQFISDPSEEPNISVVINGTPIRRREEDSEGLLERWIRPGAIYIDMNYADEPSWFIEEAQRLGCDTMDGLPMLLAQAERQFKLWTGVDLSFSSKDAGY